MRNKKMCDANEKEKDRYLMLGHLCEREDIGKRFQREAGELFARGLDEQAEKLRAISRELILSAKQMRKDYDKKYHQ